MSSGFENAVTCFPANRKLDFRTGLAVFFNQTRHQGVRFREETATWVPDGYSVSLRELAEMIQQIEGTRTSAAYILKVWREGRANANFGIDLVRIEFLYGTGVTAEAMRQELALRQTGYNETLPVVLEQSKAKVFDLRKRVDRGIPWDERDLALAALDSLDQQIALYEAHLIAGNSLPNTEERYALFQRALRSGEAAFTRLAEYARPQKSTVIMTPELLIIAKTLINSAFATQEIDRLEGNIIGLPRLTNFAKSKAARRLFEAGAEAAIASSDPRIAHDLAEVAILASDGEPPIIEQFDVRSLKFSNNLAGASAQLLYLAKTLDGHEATPVRQWQPNWRWSVVPRIEETLQIIEAFEHRRN